MSKNYNDFCLYCAGNKTKDIRECREKECPFYSFKYGGLEGTDAGDIYKKILT